MLAEWNLKDFCGTSYVVGEGLFRFNFFMIY